MPRLGQTPAAVRARVPEVLRSYEETRDAALGDGLVEAALKQLCFRVLLEDREPAEFSGLDGRTRAALKWTQAIASHSELADDELWTALHAHFSEPELVELGYAIAYELGQQHWLRTLALPPLADHAPT